MDHDRRACADQILKAIEYGHIPKKEIERRLYEIIDSELSGPLHAEWDRTKVDLCHELLWELYTNGEEPFPDSAEAIKERVAEKHSAYKRKKTILKYGLRVAAIVIVLVAISAVIGLTPSVHWFHIASTPDEQQAVVTKREINMQTVAVAIDSHNQSDSFSSADKAEVVEFLGFDPGLPDSLCVALLPERYNVSISPEYIRIACRYSDSGKSKATGEVISIRLTVFTSSDNAKVFYEQDQEGEHIVIQGIPVYRYTNEGKVSYLWMEDHTIVRLMANVQSDEVETCVEETIDWRSNK